MASSSNLSPLAQLHEGQGDLPALLFENQKVPILQGTLKLAFAGIISLIFPSEIISAISSRAKDMVKYRYLKNIWL